MIRLKSWMLAAAAPVLLSACATAAPPPPPVAATPPPVAEAPAKPKPAYGTFGFDTAGMDRSVAPGDDFSPIPTGPG